MVEVTMSRSLLVFLVVGCNHETTTTPSGTAVDVTGYPQGEYLTNLSIAPVGGLSVPFQLTVTTDGVDGAPAFTTFELRAWSPADDSLSDVLVTAEDVPVDLATGFVAELPQFTLPAAYSVTGSDVDVLATLIGEGVGADGLCGSVEGELASFGIDLAGSTFGSAPWDLRADGAPSACGEGTVTEVPRIETCPTLTAGLNTGFPSGGESREFEIVLPSDYDPTHQYPLIVVYHGFGGTIAEMLDGTGLRPYADALDVILAVPQGQDLGGTPGFDAFSAPETNLDTVLFDDLVTCATASFSVDPNRIHVTGMSNGGLETGMLIATRSGVIASAAPMSGGVGLPYEDSGYEMPALVVWGGESDFAFEQDFNQLTLDMMALFEANGQFVVGCDHGLGHTLDPSFWPWVLQFLLDHPRDLATEPYAAGLPPAFPDYCAIQ